MPEFNYIIDNIEGELSQYLSGSEANINMSPSLEGAFNYSTNLLTTVSKENDEYLAPGGGGIILDDSIKMSDQTFVWPYLGNKLDINSVILKRKNNHDVKEERMRIWLFDDLLYDIDTTLPYDDLVDEFIDNRSDFNKTHQSGFSGKDEDTSAHRIYGSGTIHKLPLSTSEDISGIGDTADPETMISHDMARWSEAQLTNNSSFYILVEIKANAKKTGPDFSRKKSNYLFELPKSLYWQLMKEYANTGKTKWTIFWGSTMMPAIVDINYGMPGRVERGGADSGAAYNIKGFEIIISIDRSNIYDTIQFNDMVHFPIEYKDQANWPIYIDKTSIGATTENNFDPQKSIDYITLMDPGNSFITDNRLDFRPISNIYINYNDELFSIQRYYDRKDIGALVSTALNEVHISFDLSTDIENIEDFYTLDDFTADNGGVKFRVVQWGDETNIKSDYDLIQNFQSINLDDYPYQEVFIDDENKGILSHVYFSGGTYDIKTFVFSYIRHPDNNNLEQAIRWKLVTTKIFLNDPEFEIEDFSSLSGHDFVTIPWPHTVPIISGISEKSKYKKSLKLVTTSGLFSDNESNDLSVLKASEENDEMGSYLGKTDTEQVRVFINGEYDLDALIDVEEFNINNINNNKLKDDCILEFNLGDIEDDYIRDSSGNGSKGILIGDYSIKKEDKDIEIMKKTLMKVPVIGTNDKAL